MQITYSHSAIKNGFNCHRKNGVKQEDKAQLRQKQKPKNMEKKVFSFCLYSGSTGELVLYVPLHIC